MIDGCCPSEITSNIYSLSDLADISQVIIAIVNLVLVCVFFFRQSDQSKRANSKSVRLQWFKELIMQPSLPLFYQFFEDIENLRGKLLAPNLDNDGYQDIGRLIRTNFSRFKMGFNDPLIKVDDNLYNKIKKIIEDLDQLITNKMLDDKLDFSNDLIFHDNISAHLSKSKMEILNLIISFEG